MGLSRNSIVLSPFSVVVGSIVAPPAGFDKRVFLSQSGVGCGILEQNPEIIL